MSATKQQNELKSIMQKYDGTTQKLYSDILKLYTSRSAGSTKTIIRREITNLVQEATK